MAVYSFSIRPGNVKDKRAVVILKQYCDKEGLNFSTLIVEGIKEVLDKRGLAHE